MDHKDKKTREDFFGNHLERKSGFWSFLYSNETLRRVISARMTTSNIGKRELAREIGVAHNNLLTYLNRKRNLKKGITDLNIIQICEAVGIDVSLEIKISPIKMNLKSKKNK